MSVPDLLFCRFALHVHGGIFLVYGHLDWGSAFAFSLLDLQGGSLEDIPWELLEHFIQIHAFIILIKNHFLFQYDFLFNGSSTNGF
jgi:hypothetical protein